MNLYLIRHGETEYNKNKYYYGRDDVAINEIGIIQCEKISKILEKIDFKTVYISEMKRTQQTAQIILKNRKYKIIKDSRINERNFGVFEGKNYNKIKELYPQEWKNWCEDWKNAAPPEGESYVQFYSKIKDFMDDILKIKDDNVLIVSHGGVIRCIYCYIMNNNLDLFWKFNSKNGDISIVKYEYGNLYIDSITHISMNLT